MASRFRETDTPSGQDNKPASSEQQTSSPNEPKYRIYELKTPVTSVFNTYNEFAKADKDKIVIYESYEKGKPTSGLDTFDLLLMRARSLRNPQGHSGLKSYITPDNYITFTNSYAEENAGEWKEATEPAEPIMPLSDAKGRMYGFSANVSYGSCVENVSYESGPILIIRGASPAYEINQYPKAGEEFLTNLTATMLDVGYPRLLATAASAVLVGHPQMYGIEPGKLQQELKEELAKHKKERKNLRAKAREAARAVLMKYSIAKGKSDGLSDAQVDNLVKEFDDLMKLVKVTTLASETGGVGKTEEEKFDGKKTVTVTKTYPMKTVEERVQANLKLANGFSDMAADALEIGNRDGQLFLHYNKKAVENKEMTQKELDQTLKKQLQIVADEIQLNYGDSHSLLKEIEKMTASGYSFQYDDTENNDLEELKKSIRNLTHLQNTQEAADMRTSMMPGTTVRIDFPTPDMEYRYELSKANNKGITVQDGQLSAEYAQTIQVHDKNPLSEVAVDPEALKKLVSMRLQSLGVSLDKTNGYLYSSAQINNESWGTATIKFTKQQNLLDPEVSLEGFVLDLGVPYNLATGTGQRASALHLTTKAAVKPKISEESAAGTEFNKAAPEGGIKQEPAQAEEGPARKEPQKKEEAPDVNLSYSTLSGIVPKPMAVTSDWSLNVEKINWHSLMSGSPLKRSMFTDGFTEGFLDSLKRSSVRYKMGSPNSRSEFSVNLEPALVASHFKYPFLSAFFAYGVGVGISEGYSIIQKQRLGNWENAGWSLKTGMSAGTVLRGKDGMFSVGPLNGDSFNFNYPQAPIMARAELVLGMDYTASGLDLNLASSAIGLLNNDILNKQMYGWNNIDAILREQIHGSLDILKMLWPRFYDPVQSRLLFGATAQASKIYGAQLTGGYVGISFSDPKSDGPAYVMSIKYNFTDQGPFPEASASIRLSNSVKGVLKWSQGWLAAGEYSSPFQVTGVSVGIESSLPDWPLYAIAGQDRQENLRREDEPQQIAMRRMVLAGNLVLAAYEWLLGAKDKELRYSNDIDAQREQLQAEIDAYAKAPQNPKSTAYYRYLQEMLGVYDRCKAYRSSPDTASKDELRAYTENLTSLEANIRSDHNPDLVENKYKDAKASYDMAYNSVLREDRAAFSLLFKSGELTKDKNYSQSKSMLSDIKELDVAQKANPNGQIYVVYDQTTLVQSKKNVEDDAQTNFKTAFGMIEKINKDLNSPMNLTFSPMNVEKKKSIGDKDVPDYTTTIYAALSDMFAQQAESLKNLVNPPPGTSDKEKQSWLNAPERHLFLVVDGSKLDLNGRRIGSLDKMAGFLGLEEEEADKIREEFEKDQSRKSMEQTGADGQTYVIRWGRTPKERNPELIVCTKPELENWQGICKRLNVKVHLIDVGGRQSKDLKEFAQNTGGTYEGGEPMRRVWADLNGASVGQFAAKFDGFFSNGVLKQAQDKFGKNYDYGAEINLSQEKGFDNAEQIVEKALEDMNETRYGFGKTGETSSDCSGLPWHLVSLLNTQKIQNFDNAPGKKIAEEMRNLGIKLKASNELEKNPETLIDNWMAQASKDRMQLEGTDGTFYELRKNTDETQIMIYRKLDVVAVNTTYLPRSGREMADYINRQLPNVDYSRRLWHIEQVRADEQKDVHGGSVLKLQRKDQNGKVLETKSVIVVDDKSSPLIRVAGRAYFTAMDQESQETDEYVLETRVRQRPAGQTKAKAEPAYCIAQTIGNKKPLPGKSGKAKYPYMLFNALTEPDGEGGYRESEYMRALLDSRLMVLAPTQNRLENSYYTEQDKKDGEIPAGYEVGDLKRYNQHMGLIMSLRGEIRIREDEDLLKPGGLPKFVGVQVDQKDPARTITYKEMVNANTREVHMQWKQGRHLALAKLVLDFDPGGKEGKAHYYEYVFKGGTPSSGVADAEVAVFDIVGTPADYTLKCNHLTYTEMTTRRGGKVGHTHSAAGTGNKYTYIIDNDAFNYFAGTYKSEKRHDESIYYKSPDGQGGQIMCKAGFDIFYGRLNEVIGSPTRNERAHVMVSSLLKTDSAVFDKAMAVIEFIEDITLNYPKLKLKEESLNSGSEME